MTKFRVEIENKGHSSRPESKEEQYVLLMDNREVFKSGWVPQSYWKDVDKKAQEWADGKITQLKMCL